MRRLEAPIRTHGFQLTGWQEAAVDAWFDGAGRPCHGTLEIVTGGGKTLIALACAERIAASTEDLHLAIVVPTKALAEQWVDSVLRYTNLTTADVGLLGAGRKATFADRRVVVAVLNTAAKRLPEIAEGGKPLMLVVDECHRAGAPRYSRVLTTPSAFRLGLSATPDRDEVDEAGEPIAFDEQRVGEALGGVVFRFSLKDAREAGWLPDYHLHHHGLELRPEERQQYEALSRRIDDLADRLREVGIEVSRARQEATRSDSGHVRLAQAYVATTSQRKDLLYRATERARVTARLVTEALQHNGERRILLFHERVDEAEALFESLRLSPGARAVLEHSQLRPKRRTEALDAFRSGEANVLVSVKSLVEGINVPEADIGLSVASTSSVRQRVQALGRVLRRQFDESLAPKQAEMHLLYVADTVDELIYAKEDWGDLTGDGANHYWRWSLDPAALPEEQDGPPATPKPTEDQELARLGGSAPATPDIWYGVVKGQEYSVDTHGTVTNAFGSMIANPQGVGSMVEAVRGRPGGRFRVTPQHRFVLVWGDGPEGLRPYVAGRLDEPFFPLPEAASEFDAASVGALKPGDVYEGPGDTDGGTYKLGKKKGGVIERRVADGVEFALTALDGDPQLVENARNVLEAWRQHLDKGTEFYVNSLDHAWFKAGGQRRFLANVPGGFAWPSEVRVEH